MSVELGRMLRRQYEGYTRRLEGTWINTLETTQERDTPPASSESRSEWTPPLTSGRQRYHGTLPANSLEEFERYYENWRNIIRTGRVSMVVSPRTFSELALAMQNHLMYHWDATFSTGLLRVRDAIISADSHAPDGVAYMLQEDAEGWGAPPPLVAEYNESVRSRRLGSRPRQETAQDLELRLHNIREEMKLTILSKPAEWRRLAESEKALVKQVIATRAKAPAPEPSIPVTEDENLLEGLRQASDSIRERIRQESLENMARTLVAQSTSTAPWLTIDEFEGWPS